MELLIALAMKFWQWSILIALIIIGFIVNLFDKKDNSYRINFKYEEFPHMKPIPIKTKGKGFWKGILLWLLGTIQWEIVKDFKANNIIFSEIGSVSYSHNKIKVL